MGSSKDLAKHIRVVVSLGRMQGGWTAGEWEDPPSEPHTYYSCSYLQCDGVDLTPKIQDLKPQCIVFLNIPR